MNAQELLALANKTRELDAAERQRESSRAAWKRAFWESEARRIRSDIAELVNRNRTPERTP